MKRALRHWETDGAAIKMYTAGRMEYLRNFRRGRDYTAREVAFIAAQASNIGYELGIADRSEHALCA